MGRAGKPASAAWTCGGASARAPNRRMAAPTQSRPRWLPESSVLHVRRLTKPRKPNKPRGTAERRTPGPEPKAPSGVRRWALGAIAIAGCAAAIALWPRQQPRFLLETGANQNVLLVTI